MEICGVIHVSQNQLVSVLIDDNVISYSYGDCSLSNKSIFKITMQEIFVYKDDAYVQHKDKNKVNVLSFEFQLFILKLIFFNYLYSYSYRDYFCCTNIYYIR